MLLLHSTRRLLTRSRKRCQYCLFFLHRCSIRTASAVLVLMVTHPYLTYVHQGPTNPCFHHIQLANLSEHFAKTRGSFESTKTIWRRDKYVHTHQHTQTQHWNLNIITLPRLTGHSPLGQHHLRVVRRKMKRTHMISTSRSGKTPRWRARKPWLANSWTWKSLKHLRYLVRNFFC